MQNLETELRERGWSNIPFGISEIGMAEYAGLANRVIEMTLDDPSVQEALALELEPQLARGNVRTGQFGVGRSRNSADDKIYLHAGYYSRKYFESQIPASQQYGELLDFWDAHDEVLAAVENSMRGALLELGAASLGESIFSEDQTKRNVHIRTVRYVGAQTGAVGDEVVSGHADLGCVTEHLYETHGGWFYGTPYDRSLITDTDTPEKRQAISEMRQNLQPIVSKPGMATLFLGANWHTMPPEYVPSQVADIPACYHVGFKPDASHEEAARDTEWVTMGRPDRVSVVVFGHPNIGLLKSGEYEPATVPMCRPKYDS